MADDYMSINQAAERLSVSGGTVRNEIRAGRLPAYRFRGAYRIRPEDLAAYVEGCRVAEVPKASRPPALPSKAGGAPFTHLDGGRLLDAWRRQGVLADRPGGRTPRSSASSCGPSEPPES